MNEQILYTKRNYLYTNSFSVWIIVNIELKYENGE